MRRPGRRDGIGLGRRLDPLLEQAGLEVGAPRALQVAVVALAVAALGGATIAGPLGAALSGVGLIAAGGGWIRRRTAARHAAVVAALPDLLETAARSMRGGADLRTALDDARRRGGPARHSLDRLAASLAAGARLQDALHRWVEEFDHDDAGLVGAVVGLGDTTGAVMAPALDRAAATLRERASIRAELAALTAQTRASSLVVGVAPLGFMAVVAMTDPAVASTLVDTSWGRACLLAGLTLDGIGLWWMNRLTEAAT